MKKTLLVAMACGAMLANTSCNVAKNLDMNRLSQAQATAVKALTLSNDEVIAYTKQTIDYMDAQNKIAPATSPYAKRLNSLIGGITSVGGIPLNFKVYETKEVNAFACADGSVRIYTGIMDVMDDDQLLGIIGHEIGHVAMEHSKNAFKNQLLNNALLQAIGSTNGSIATLTDSQLGQLANAYMSAKYSRKQENEADEFGYEFLKGAGRNPYTMVMAFEKMQGMENSGNPQQVSYFSKMFSSHPETQERIDHIKALCQRDGFKRPAK